MAIRHAEADYLLALKGNHGTLHGEVRDLFADPAALVAARVAGKAVAAARSYDKGHGRVEERHSWLDLRSLVHLRSVRQMSDGRRSEEDRYWLPSQAPDAERLWS
ncbi:MAG: hypothetical protein RLZZ214_2372 [Verrucomicrobiota bacterium]